MNLFELFIKVGVDDQASGKLEKLSSKLGNGLKTAAKIGTAAVAAAAAGITALTTAAVKNYAEYEQLVGGVDTLFKNSSKKVQKYAQDAYKTAGLSANKYMETVTSFSASLLQSLENDTEIAAEYADMAIIDMADNANKMGTSIEMIQSAYQGFAKQNYTMLDNLKLGYGGTKTEIERLLRDADKLSKKFNLVENENGDLVYSFADVVEAIHIVQDEMGITGTTAAEASETIAGSVSSMKAAWQNLITELGKSNGDLKSAMSKLVETIVGDKNGEGGVLSNLLPTIDTIFEGITQLVDELVPRLVQALPGFIEKYVPMLTESALHLVETIISAIGDNSGKLAKSLASAISSIILHAAENTPELIGSILDLIFSLIAEIGNNLGSIIPAFINSITGIFTEIAKRSSELTDAAFAIINGIIDALTSPEASASMIAAGLNLLIALTAGMITALPDLVTNLDKVIETIVNNFSGADGKGIGKSFGENVGGGIEEAWTEIKEKFNSLWQKTVDEWELYRPMRQKVWGSIKKFFTDTWEEISTFFTEVWDSTSTFFSNMWEKIQEFLDKPAYYIGWAIGSVVDAIRTFFTETIPGAWNNFTTWLSDSFDKLVESVKTFFTETIPNAWSGLTEKVGSLLENVKNKISTFFSVTIPAKWEEFKGKMITKIQSIKDWFSNLPSTLKTIGTNIVNGLWNGIRTAWTTLTSSVGNLFSNLVKGIKDRLGIKSPSRLFRDEIGKQLAAGLGIGWETEFDKVKGGIEKSLDFSYGDISLGSVSVGKGSASAFGGTSFGNVTINVEGAKYNDAHELAEEISREIQNLTDRRSAVYA